ncbi:MAG: TolC family protein [Moraxellaceae bacterium]
MTPKPLTADDIAQAGKQRMDELQRKQAAMGEALSLPQALAWALDNNLSLRAEALEKSLARQNQRIASVAMLPNITAQAGYRWRSNISASSSQNIVTGQQSLVPSTSSDRTGTTASLEASWNVLDFSLAWLRARTEGEKLNLAAEARRRMSHQLALEVTYAWQRAALYQQIEPELVRIREEVRHALGKVEKVAATGLSDPVALLEYKASLLLILKRMDSLVAEMNQSRDELGRLLGTPPGMALRLVPSAESGVPHLPALAVEDWQYLALLHRPEVRMGLYAQRNAERGAYRKMVEQFPSLLFKYGTNYDSNSFLVNDRWEDSSVNLSMSLMRLATLPLQRRLGELEKQQAALQVDIQSVAVMTQVAIAHKALSSVAMQECLGGALLKTTDQKMALLDARFGAATVDELTMVRSRVDHLLLRIEREMSRVELNRAMLVMAQSVGVGGWPDDVLDMRASDERLARIAEWTSGGMVAALSEAAEQAAKQRSAEQAVVQTPEKGEIECL